MHSCFVELGSGGIRHALVSSVDFFAQMELIFLGTGTSQGVPMIAQPDGACDLQNPKNWRTRCSVHVVMDGYHIQVDAAPELRLQCIHNSIQQVDSFVLTHSHADHILGMDDLRRFCDLKGGQALPVYSSEDGLQRIAEIYPYAILDSPKVKGYPAFQLELMPQRLELPGGWVDSVRLPHGPMEVLGLVFTERSSRKKLVYYTDCKRVGPEARALAAGADVVVLDGLRPEPHPSHMTVQEAIDTALALQAERSFITHMTYKIDHETVDAALPASIFLAYDGLRLTI